MVIRVGINGFGRIGRVIFRTCCQNPDIEITAINDPAIELEYICYLIKFDSTHGKYKGTISHEGNEIKVNDKPIKVFHHKAPADIPWQNAGVQCVVEASGMFTTLDKASNHLASEGVKRVLVTAPSADVPMLILGVNEDRINPDLKVISCGSSTLYCLAPIVKLLQDAFGVAEGFVTSIHAMTPSLKPLDGLCIRGKHWKDHRSIHQNIIPAATGACKALGRIIPAVRDKLTGLAFRVPIVNVSVLDLSIRLNKYTNIKEITQCVLKFQDEVSQKIIQVSNEQAVSSDFIGDDHSCTLDVDSSLELRPNFFKLICWYENEYSYACRVVDTIILLERQHHTFIVPPLTRRAFVRPTFMNVHSEQGQSAKKNVAVDCVSFPFLRTNHYDVRPAKPVLSIPNRPTSASVSGATHLNKPKALALGTPRRTEAFKTSIDHLVKSTSVQYKTGFNDNSKTPPNKIQKECTISPEYLETVRQELTRTMNKTEDLHKIINDKKLELSFAFNRLSKDVSEKERDKELSSVTGYRRKRITDNSGKNTDERRNNLIIEVCGGCKSFSLCDKPCIRGETTSQNILDDNSKKTFHTPDISKSCQTVNNFEKIPKSFENKSVSCESENLISKIVEIIPKDNTVPGNIKEDCKMKETEAVNNVKEESKINESTAVDNLKNNLCENVTGILFGDSSTLNEEQFADEVIHIIENSECEKTSFDENINDNMNINESHELNVCVGMHDTKSKEFYNVDIDETAKPLNQTLSKKELVDEILKQRNIILNYVNETVEFQANETNETIAPRNYQEDEQDCTGVQRCSHEPLMIMTEETSRCESVVNTITTMSNNEIYRSKQDIYDKLDSASVSGSESSFQIIEKKSQVINIADLSYSLEDLSRLDKICRIIEISDELSDKLFAPLENKTRGEAGQQKWSFKDLCERIKLDEFCNNVFGKNAS